MSIEYPEMPSLLTPKQAAAFLNLSPSILAKWRVTGDGPRYCKLSASVRYAPDDLREFVSLSMRQSTSEARDGQS